MEIMRRDTAEEFSLPALRRHWPHQFKKGRIFNRDSANKSYISFIQEEILDSGDEDEDKDDYENVEEEEEGWSDIGHDSNHYEDEAGNYKDETENKDERTSYHMKNDQETGFGRRHVRIFMTGFIGDDDKLPYRDQVEQVSSFCESAGWEVDEGATGKQRKIVALLDDRNDLDTGVTDKGRSRPYLGPLTSQELGVELSKKVTLYLLIKVPVKLTHYAAPQCRTGPIKTG
jgi:hypothetical protein